MFVATVLLACLASVALGKVQFLGMNIAGGDFGCQITGTCPTGSTQLPLGDGPGQMKHFVQDDQMSMFRLPISWQFLVNNNLGATLDSSNLGKYDQLVQACLATGAYCMIDIHNFARWNGGIIGQGGPTDDQFVSLWTQLATKYAANAKVVFELMNEPHDLDINLWAATCQKVVTAIRNAGATVQMILLPGTNFDSAATLVSSGSADALMGITNPDGTADGLLLDIHKYLDVDNSGTHKPCVTDNTDAFQSVADYLRQKGRKGIVSETGASNDPTCFTNFCSQNAFINANADVFIGLVAWAAGSFDQSYLLSLTPSKSGSTFKDNALASQCVVGTWLNSTNTVPPPAASTSSVSRPTTAASTTTRITTSPTPSTTISTTGSNDQDTTIGSYFMTVTVNTGSMPASLAVATGTPTKPPAGGAVSSSTLLSGGSNSSSVAKPSTSTVPSEGNWSKKLGTSGWLLGLGVLAALAV